MPSIGTKQMSTGNAPPYWHAATRLASDTASVCAGPEPDRPSTTASPSPKALRTRGAARCVTPAAGPPSVPCRCTGARNERQQVDGPGDAHQVRFARAPRVVQVDAPVEIVFLEQQRRGGGAARGRRQRIAQLLFGPLASIDGDQPLPARK